MHMSCQVRVFFSKERQFVEVLVDVEGLKVPATVRCGEETSLKRSIKWFGSHWC